MAASGTVVPTASMSSTTPRTAYGPSTCPVDSRAATAYAAGALSCRTARAAASSTRTTSASHHDADPRKPVDEAARERREQEYRDDFGQNHGGDPEAGAGQRHEQQGQGS